MNDQEEYEALMADACESDTTVATADIGRAVRDALFDAAQAGRSWAEHYLDVDQLAGCQARAKMWLRRRHTVAFKSHDGVVLNKAAVAGIKRRDPETGEANHHYQQSLFKEMSTQELREHVAALLREQESRRIRIDRELELLAICERHPEAHGPDEACLIEGTTIEAVLAGEEEAA